MMMRKFDVVRGGALAIAAVLAGCTSPGSGGGTSFTDLILNTGPAAPVAPKAPIDIPDCPPVDIGEGGAALRTVAGRTADPGAVRSQISIANVARECVGQPDGSILVKVGIQGRALEGPGGSIGRSSVPVYVVLKRGTRILASRSRQVPIKVPPGDDQGTFVVVEEGLAVPPGIGGEFEIEVGLGNRPAGEGPAPAKRRRRS